QRGVPLAPGQRRELRPVQPACRGLALVDRRHLRPSSPLWVNGTRRANRYILLRRRCDAGSLAGEPAVARRPGDSNLTLGRSRSLIAAALVAAIGASAVVAAPPIAAQQQPGSERNQIRSGDALVTVNVDVLRAEDTEVSGALSDVRENVNAQKAAL